MLLVQRCDKLLLQAVFHTLYVQSSMFVLNQSRKCHTLNNPKASYLANLACDWQG